MEAMSPDELGFYTTHAETSEIGRERRNLTSPSKSAGKMRERHSAESSPTSAEKTGTHQCSDIQEEPGNEVQPAGSIMVQAVGGSEARFEKRGEKQKYDGSLYEQVCLFKDLEAIF